MTPEQLKTALADQGFSFGVDHLRNTGIDWYAWRRLTNVPDCQCNDKPPSLVIYPYHVRLQDRDWFSVEIEVTGQIHDERWIKAKLYSVPMDEAIAHLPHAERVLSVVWNSAATIEP